MNIEIANRLVQLRKQNGLSQEELAARIGISRQAVSKWERAEASPDTDNLILLARLYKVSLDDLLRTEEDIPLPEPAAEKATSPADSSRQMPQSVPDSPETQEDSPDDPPPEGGGEVVGIGPDGLCIQDGEERTIIGPDGIRIQDSDGEVSLALGELRITDAKVSPSRTWKRRRWADFPYPVLALIVFFLLGFLGGWWHPGWLVFLTVPVYYGIVEMVVEKDCLPSYVYPVLTVIAFLLLGFLGGWWAWAWVVFLTIPLYYALFPDRDP
jgi:transcriptional regulator with XRE-family HTH domain